MIIWQRWHRDLFPQRSKKRIPGRRLLQVKKEHDFQSINLKISGHRWKPIFVICKRIVSWIEFLSNVPINVHLQCNNNERWNVQNYVCKGFHWTNNQEEQRVCLNVKTGLKSAQFNRGRPRRVPPLTCFQEQVGWGPRLCKSPFNIVRANSSLTPPSPSC